MTIGGSSDSIPNSQQDLGLSVSQKPTTAEETADPTKVGQATRVGELESGEGGKKTATYNVKMTMPDGTSKSYKIRVGFNDAQLRQHVKDSGGDGAELANVIDRIVDSMDASSIAKLSGHQISSRLNEWDKATVSMKGGRTQTIAQLKNNSNREIKSLGSSAEKVIKAFDRSAIGQAMQSSTPSTIPRPPPPSSRDGPQNSDLLARNATQSTMTTRSTEQGRQRSSSESGGESPTVTNEANTPASRKPLPPIPNQKKGSELSSDTSSPPVASKIFEHVDGRNINQHIPKTSQDSNTEVQKGPLTPGTSSNQVKPQSSTREQPSTPTRRNGPPPPPPPTDQPSPPNIPTGKNVPQRPLTPPPQRPDTNLEPRSRSASDPVAQGQSSQQAKGKDDLGQVVSESADGGRDVEDLIPPALLDIEVIEVTTSRANEQKPTPEVPSENPQPNANIKEALAAASSPKSLFRRRNSLTTSHVTDILTEVTQASKEGRTINLNGSEEKPFTALATLLESNGAFRKAVHKELGKNTPNEALLNSLQEVVKNLQSSMEKVSPELARDIENTLKDTTSISTDKTGRETVQTDPKKLQTLAKMLQYLPKVQANMAAKRKPPPSLSQVERDASFASGQFIAGEIDNHIQQAKSNPEVATENLMKASQKMNQLRELRSNSPNTKGFDKTVKISEVEQSLNEAIQKQAKLTSEEEKQFARLKEGNWKRITPEKAANLMKKELLVAATDLKSCSKSPIMDALKREYPVEFSQALAENPEVAMLAADREKLQTDYQTVLAAGIPIRDYAKHFRSNQETQEQIKAGKITTKWEDAEKKGLSRVVFDNQLKGIEQKRIAVEEDKQKAENFVKELKTIIKDSPGSQQAEAAKSQLEDLEKFIAADDQAKCEMSDVKNMADKTPLNVITGIGSNIGTAFPPGKVSFTLKEIESGQLKMTLKYLKQSDPTNSEKYDTLIESFNELEVALTEHAQTFNEAKCFINAGDKIEINPELKGSPELRSAVTELQQKLETIEKKLNGINFPDLPPQLSDQTATYQHAGHTAVEFLLPQCSLIGSNQKFLNQIQTQLGMN